MLENGKTDFAMTLGRMTSVIQSVAVRINKSFKDIIKNFTHPL
jgi:hypothetical protein